jgi:hypothetical protein
MNKKLIKENTHLKERNQLLETAVEDMKKAVCQIHSFVKKEDQQKQFYTSIPEDEL